MNVALAYKETQYLSIKSIYVIGDFNGNDPQKGQMVKKEGIWLFERMLAQGEYHYKFLINNKIKMNDPKANFYYADLKGEIWSVLLVNEKGERLYNNTEYSVHIENYNMTAAIYEKLVPNNKKEFNLLLDKKVVVCFQFGKVMGLHSVTAVWYTPRGEVFQVAENNLFTPEDLSKPITLWFWIDLQDPTQIYPHGIWTVKLFIDGEFILEDVFALDKVSTYSFNRQLELRRKQNG